MEVVAIPDVFMPKGDTSVQLYDYRSIDKKENLLVKLTRNTFSFLLEGNKEVITGDSSLAIDNSKFLLMKSGHCLMTEKLSPTNDRYRSMLLFFSDQELFELLGEVRPKQSSADADRVIYSFQHDHFTISFLKSLSETAKLPKGVKETITKVKLKELLLYLIDSYGPAFLHSMISNIGQNQRFTDVIENNKYTKLSLKELAFLTNRSVSSFKREFEKHYSESPSKWFQDRRLEYASYLLTKEQMRPSDVHLTVGYENLSSFVQAFKGKYGVTPKQYQLS